MKFFLIALFSCFATFSFSQTETEAAPLTYYEQMPTFPGGQTAMYRYIYSNLKYPAEALENKISGQVIVQFTVAKDGTLSEIQTIRGIGYGCDEEAVRVVESMNESHKWDPGKHNGLTVPVRYTLPIKFVLK